MDMTDDKKEPEPDKALEILSRNLEEVKSTLQNLNKKFKEIFEPEPDHKKVLFGKLKKEVIKK